MISESTIAKLKNLINNFEQREGILSEVMQTSSNCTDCYSSGGCKGTCKGSCQSTCGYYQRRY